VVVRGGVQKLKRKKRGGTIENKRSKGGKIKTKGHAIRCIKQSLGGKKEKKRRIQLGMREP